MTKTPMQKLTFDMIERYKKGVRKELLARWKAWKLDLTKIEVHEVVGGILARQVTLATQLSSNFGIWNGHVAPILLRSMADNYINLAWIFMDTQKRSEKFIEYGLGQQKLMIEHRKNEPSYLLNTPSNFSYTLG